MTSVLASPVDLAPSWLSRLVEEHGLAETPAYVYDLAQVRANAASLMAQLPATATLCYSLKANPHPDVLRTLRDQGVGAEVCSPGELEAALEAGYSGHSLLYGGPGKRDRDVAYALSLGVRLFSIDSPDGLEQVGRLAQMAGTQVECLVRVNDDTPAAGQGLTMTGKVSQFGADAAWIERDPSRFAGNDYARTVGLHFYMGTNISLVDDLLAQFDQVLSTARRMSNALGSAGCMIRTLDLGGGFAAPFASAGERVSLAGLGEGLERLLDRHFGPIRPELIFESGRYLVATAGALVTRVLESKESQGTRVAVLDAGINQLGGMSGMRRLPPLNPTLLTASTGDRGPTLLAGPLCTPLDSWCRAAHLPPLSVNDMVVVPNVGAYGLRASLMGFLAHPPAIEMVTDSDLAEPRVVSSSRLTLQRQPC